MAPPPRPRPPPRLDSEDDDGSLTLNVTKHRAHAPSAPAPPTLSIYTQQQQQQQHQQSQQYGTSPSLSSPNLQNYSRPSAQRPVIRTDVPTASAVRTASPLTRGHHRKHSTQGLFEPTLPSTSTSNLSHVGMSQPAASAPSPALSASQIAAQAAFQHGNNSNSRLRSQTIPPASDAGSDAGSRRGSGANNNHKGPLSPPALSLTEASAPRENGFGHQGYHNGLLGNHSAAAASAANAAYPRSGPTSPALPPPPAPHQHPPSPVHQLSQPIPDLRPAKPEKEKSKHKLFSRPGKIGVKGEAKEKPLPSPSKIGSALASLQRGNFSTSSLVDPGSSPSMYSLTNSSSATIRPSESGAIAGAEGKEKEKKHNFLARQKQKLKDEYHLPLSSAASNSKPTDPSAPSSLYSFNVPASPVPTSSSFNKVRKDKKAGERSDSRLDSDSTYTLNSEWPGPSSLSSSHHTNASSAYLLGDMDPLARHGTVTNVSLDDAWPYLRAKMLVVFEGEDLRQPVEDFNRLVTMHIQYCIQRRSPNIIIEDLRDLLTTGFSSLDHTLRLTQEDKVIPALVEIWLVTYTSILPFVQAVFLPLDLEFSGCGSLMNVDQARDFWGGIAATSSPGDVSPASSVLDVRRIVLAAYRDVVILPRYDNLRAIFSRLSLEFLPSSFANMALASPLPDPVSALSSSPSDAMVRPGTAMSLDPSVASYGSTSTTLLGEAVSAGGSSSGGGGTSRSRAISNVSYASGGSESLRPFTPSSQQQQQMLGSVREQNVEDSKQVTEMVGRMLQCMSILAGVGVGDGSGDDGNRKMEELCRLLKLNWLGRGRTGRNRRGMVGGRIRREQVEGLRVS
ncbi:HbrB-like-domain-containing protein [Plectosphaerella plurivora]|uniref:HbrB-like-domain-containing protein n=1 Tax=Plectosphaerella plurivora TaxID=936078 RepID=A0A9P8VDA3_9PEZI|nr:HbrB-like-domain-containing protein [Plectosphaerella plurivora]